jgi:hypothetical protein
MIEFSNERESFLLRIGSLLAFGASLIPMFYSSIGRVTFFDGFIGTLFFIFVASIATIIRRNKTIEIRLLDSYLEISYPLKKLIRTIPYEDIDAAIYSELGFSLSIKVKGGEKISLGSTLLLKSGNFENLNVNPGDPHGEPGNRYKLKREIDRRKDLSLNG